MRSRSEPFSLLVIPALNAVVSRWRLHLRIALYALPHLNFSTVKAIRPNLWLLYLPASHHTAAPIYRPKLGWR